MLQSTDNVRAKLFTLDNKSKLSDENFVLTRLSIVVDYLQIRHVFVSSCGRFGFTPGAGALEPVPFYFRPEWTRSSLTRPDQIQSGPDHEIVSAPSFSPTSHNWQTTIIELRGLVL